MYDGSREYRTKEPKVEMRLPCPNWSSVAFLALDLSVGVSRAIGVAQLRHVFFKIAPQGFGGFFRRVHLRVSRAAPPVAGRRVLPIAQGGCLGVDGRKQVVLRLGRSRWRGGSWDGRDERFMEGRFQRPMDVEADKHQRHRRGCQQQDGQRGRKRPQLEQPNDQGQQEQDRHQQ